MQTYQLITWSVIALALVLGIMRFVARAEVDDRVKIPKHVPSDQVDRYTAQEVFDWVVYVTKVTGLGYLQQLNWPLGSPHKFMLDDLRMAIHLQTEEERLDYFERVGRSYFLNTEIVDAVW